MKAEEIYQKIEQIPGWLDVANIEMFMTLYIPKKAVILEIGTYCGRSAALFNLLWPTARIITCDPVDEPARVLPEGTLFIHKKGQDAALLQAEHLSLVFIDANHDYQDTKELFHRFSPLVMRGGYVVFHDYSAGEKYGADGVKQFVDELGDCKLFTEGEYGGAVWKKK